MFISVPFPLVIDVLQLVLFQSLKAEQRHEDILGHLLYAAKIVAEKEGIVDGFRVVINSGASACKSISLQILPHSPPNM